jgi:hypothetical protein
MKINQISRLICLSLYDKLHSTKRCELSRVVIIIGGRCLLGGCIYNLDGLICVILQ